MLKGVAKEVSPARQSAWTAMEKIIAANPIHRIIPPLPPLCKRGGGGFFRGGKGGVFFYIFYFAISISHFELCTFHLLHSPVIHDPSKKCLRLARRIERLARTALGSAVCIRLIHQI